MFKIKQFVSSKVCLSCDGCCRFASQDTVWSPVLLDKEIKELAGGNIVPKDISLVKKVPLKLQDNTGNFVCAFLNQQENKCRVYPRRPFDCRLYPFLLKRKGKRIFLAIDLHCPFAKNNIESQEFKDCLAYLIRLFNSRSFEALIKNNPQAAQDYPGVTILKELNI